MFYDFFNKKKMECERYQDCSWFQQDLMKDSIKGKLSLAETAEPIIDIDEFDLAMQYATDETIPRGEDDIVGFDHVFLEGNNKFEEPLKSGSARIVDDDYDYDFGPKKLVEGNATEGLNQFYGLRKTDSFDNMDYISSTNPAEIIPISLMERMNYNNGGPAPINSIKNEVVKEEELYSPDSTSQFMQADDGGFIVGREEIVEENEADIQQTCKPAQIDSDLGQLQDPASLTSNLETNQPENVPTSTIKTEHISPDKLDFNLDLPKVTFEHSLGVSTPDLDFMDLVDFINEDIKKIDSSKDQNPVQGSASKTNAADSKDNKAKQPPPPSPNDQNGTDQDDAADDNTSIAQRIKTKAKRRVTRKYVTDNGTTSEEDDDEDFEPNQEEDGNGEDDDDDEDYGAGGPKRRCTVPARKLKPVEAVLPSRAASERTGDSAEKTDSYRERRDKNNEASRRSRQNRKDRERHMFKTLEEEERRNVKLRAESDVLEKQVTSLRKLLLQVVLRKADGT